MPQFDLDEGYTWESLEHEMREVLCDLCIHATDCAARGCDVQNELTAWLYDFPSKNGLRPGSTDEQPPDRAGRKLGGATRAREAEGGALPPTPSASLPTWPCLHCGFIHLSPRETCKKCHKPMGVKV